jgi:hypothetical protein
VPDGLIEFVVENAGCESCSARVRAALQPPAEVDAIEVDEAADVARVQARERAKLTREAVDEVLLQASVGAGHAYRVLAGSWRRSPGTDARAPT